jgi:hypothetical protein
MFDASGVRPVSITIQHGVPNSGCDQTLRPLHPVAIHARLFSLQPPAIEHDNAGLKRDITQSVGEFPAFHFRGAAADLAWFHHLIREALKCTAPA